MRACALLQAMKFLQHIRSKSKIQRESSKEPDQYDTAAYYPRAGRDPSAQLPDKVLRRILTYVCPHTEDDSYTACESSGTEDGCGLCDMRDLARCALVCRSWSQPAQDLLYPNVRIDAVHYCEREVELSAKRKRKSFMNRNAVPIDAPSETLKLFSRTIWADKSLARMVLSLKVAYMTRESCKAELARCISVLPNLRYVDLPDGFYNDDPACNMLKQELQAQCSDIRRMKYATGSEQSLASIPHTRQWQSLEVLELTQVTVEATTLLYVLRTFSILRELKMVELPLVDDSIFRPNPSLPTFPPLHSLSLENMPSISAAGLVSYLLYPQNSGDLSHLSLIHTGILPQTLHQILSRAPYLESLQIVEDISRSFPAEPVPHLASRSLRTLKYEIAANNSPVGVQSPVSSYYRYLATSLHSNSLPNLRDIYVRDGDFPEKLLVAPPQPVFAEKVSPPVGLTRPLSIYSKGLDELEWNFTTISPPTAPGRRSNSSATRPVSAYSAHLGPSWGGSARKSMIVGNGFGGFLAVPTEDSPRSSGKTAKGSPKQSVDRRDLWR